MTRRMSVQKKTIKIVHMKFQRTRTPTRNWAVGHLCNILAKNLATLGTCPKILNETEFKSNGLIYLVEEISRQHSVRLSYGYCSQRLLRFTVKDRK